jgi:nitrate reductase assembly molybdenum cofactor insertion protein NarJ
LESKLINSKENIEKLEKALEENKQNYEKEISSLLEKNGKQVNDSLEATRETTRFLNLI